MWSVYLSTEMFLSFCWVMLFLGLRGARTQYFDPLVDDQVYLDDLQLKISAEVNSTRAELYLQTKIIEGITKNFVAAQLKENLFIALRVLAEKELKDLYSERARPSSSGNSLIDGQGVKKDDRHTQLNKIKEQLGEFRRPRQDDDDDDGDSVATTLRAADAAPFQMGLIPQVANLVKAIFGGNRNVNLTKYVSSASGLLPKPVGTQVVGLVSALSEPIKTTTLNKPPYTIAVQPTSPPLVVFLPHQNNKGPLRQYNEQWLQAQQNILLNKPQPLLGIQQGMPIDSGLNSTIKNQQINPEYRPQSVQLDPKINADGTKRRTVVPGQNPLNQPKPSRVVVGKPGSIQEQFQQTQNRFPVQSLQSFPTQQQLGQKVDQVQPPAFPPQPQPPRRPVDEDEDDDYDEDGRRKRQFNLASLLPSLLGNVFRTTRAPIVYQPQPAVAPVPVAAAGSPGVQTQAVATPVVQPGAVPAAIMPQGFNIRMFAQDFGKTFNISEIIRVMPDLFRGAREGVQLLQTISTVLGGFEGIAGILPGL